MKRIALVVACLASLTLTACLDDGSAVDPDPSAEPGQIDLSQAPSDQADINESVDIGTSAPVIPHGTQLDSLAPIAVSGVKSAGNGTTCCVPLKSTALELPVSGRR